MKDRKTHKKALFALAIGGFGIGLTEFVIMGILPAVARSMEISIAQAGHFIAAYALGVVVGAPFLSSIGNRWPSRKLMLFLMIWFTLFNTLSAFSVNYAMMFAMRFLSGLPHGAFFGIGAVLAGKLAREGRSAQAIATMFSGLTVANVIGVPLGTFLGNSLHWSISFMMVGVVGILTLVSIYRWMPQVETREETSGEPAGKGLRNAELWALIALTTIGTGGFFAWYSYIAPLVTDVAGMAQGAVGYAMVISGVGMVAGNVLGARMAGWFSPLKAVIISLCLMAGLLVANALLATSAPLVLLTSFLIGMTAFTVATPVQMAIIRSAKGSEMLGSSMNQSAFNMGNASGAYFAGLPIAYGYGVASASLVGAVLAAAGVGIGVGLLLYRRNKVKKENRLALCNNPG